MNDIWKSAGVRALVTAFVLGAQAATVMATQTDDPKSIVLAFMGAFFSTLALRLGVEGAIDTRRAAAAAPPPEPTPDG